MAFLKSKTKTMTEAIKALDESDEILEHKKDVPAELKTVSKEKVEKLRAFIEQRLEVLEEEAKLKLRLEEIGRGKKKLEEQLREVANDVKSLGEDDTLEIDFAGAHIKVGKKGTSRTLTDEGKVKLVDMLDEKDLIKLANFKLGDLDNYLTAKQREQVLVETRTDRSLKIEPISK